MIEPLNYEADSKALFEEDEFDGVYEIPEEGRPHSLKGIDSRGKDAIWKYCLAASLALHLTLFAAVPRLMEVAPANQPLLKPGEKLTSVRLVEPPQEEKKPEPPPEEASAISDRDHTAVKERIPKAPPTPEAPLGKIEPQKRMAALSPPVAPEHFSKPKEDKPSEDKKQEKEEVIEEKARARHKPPEHSESRPKRKEPKTGPIDLRPTPQDIAKGFSAGGSRDFFPDGDVEEAVVDINTREDRFFSYLMHLKTKIQGAWVYPSVAARSGLGGSLTVEFSIAKTGELLEVNLLDSSGHAILDESAMKAIKSAAPYFPFPPRLRAQRLRIRANFVYVTSSFFRSIM